MEASKKIFYTNHAVKQMFQRGISADEVEYVIRNGETINNYTEDKPYPRRLLFAFNNKRPLHVVCSYNIEEELIIIVTVYEPTTEFWETDFRTRKTK